MKQAILQVAIGTNKGLSFNEFIDQAALKLDVNSEHFIPDSHELKQHISLNHRRMSRLLKTIVLQEDVKQTLHSLKHELALYVITEDWCGDSAQVLPAIYQMQQFIGQKLSLTIFERDQFPELMNAFLTNGTKSIPILIVANPSNQEVISFWGPRPKQAKAIVEEWKNEVNQRPKEEMYKDLHGWYAKNATFDTQNEISKLLSAADASLA